MKFIKSLQFIFKPRYWIMNYPYNAAWDAELNILLDKYSFIRIDNHTAMLGNKEIWVSNQPYAAMRAYNFFSGRPSRLTIQRAIKKLEHDYSAAKGSINDN